MDAQHLRHLVIYLSNLKDASADWDAIVKMRGVSTKGNAQRDFKAMMKKYGIEFAQNKFTPVPSVHADAGADTAALNKPKRKSSPKKRKANTDGDDDTDGYEEPKKKQKAGKGNMKQEQQKEKCSSEQED